MPGPTRRAALIAASSTDIAPSIRPPASVRPASGVDLVPRPVPPGSPGPPVPDDPLDHHAVLSERSAPTRRRRRGDQLPPGLREHDIVRHPDCLSAHQEQTPRTAARRYCASVSNEPSITRGALGAPSSEEINALYGKASAVPPLLEPTSVAATYAWVYESSLTRDDLITASIRVDGRLIGFAYGHAWTWAEQDDAWALELEERLGAASILLERTFALCLLVVHPAYQQRGLGRTLITSILDKVPERAWLVTRDEDTPARRLYERTGWRPIGHGPDAPNGQPGLVLVSPVRCDASS